jgi:hypothetical protein
MFVTKTLHTVKQIASQPVCKYAGVVAEYNHILNYAHTNASPKPFYEYVRYITGLAALTYINPVLGLAGVWFINPERAPINIHRVDINSRLDAIKAGCDVEYCLCFQKKEHSTYNENNLY